MKIVTTNNIRSTRESTVQRSHKVHVYEHNYIIYMYFIIRSISLNNLNYHITVSIHVIMMYIHIGCFTLFRVCVYVEFFIHEKM